MSFPRRVLREMEPAASHESLALEWAFGLHKDFKSVIHNLSTSPTDRVVFYTIGHVGVIYDAVQNTQRHLMGHRHTIIASACSRNRRFIVTADAGNSGSDNGISPNENVNGNDNGGRGEESYSYDTSVMIVWDTQTGMPVRTIPTGKYGGVVACAMSLDAMYVATLNRRVPQEIMLWGWTADEDVDEHGLPSDFVPDVNLLGNDIEPEYRRSIPAQDEQTSIRFSEDDPHLIVTNGLHRVLFWSWAEGELKYYSPPILSKNLKVPIGNFTQTIFVPGTSMACSGTVDGDVILWELQPRDRVTKEQDKTMLKMVRIHSAGVSFLGWTSGYIVTGGIDGHVKFLDPKLRLIAWFEDLTGGAITSISFDRPVISAPLALEEMRREFKMNTQKKVALVGTKAVQEFSAPDFMVSTANAMIISVLSKSFHTGNTELLRGKLIVQGQDKGIQCIVAHPKLTRLAIAGYSGSLHIWDYISKRVSLLSIFQNIQIHCMAYDPEGIFLALGCTNGVLKFLDADSLEERKSIKPKRPDCITRLVFSHDGKLLAAGDIAGCVALYEYDHPQGNTTKPMEWDIVGRHKTHRAAISGLQFGDDGGLPRLLSVGEDKRLVEYDLIDSEVESGLLVRSAHKITQGAIPTGLLWVKEDGVISDMKRRNTECNNPSNGDMLLIPTSEYKITVFLSDWSRQCIKSVLSPTFGGPVVEMFTVPTNQENNTPCLFYATREKVIGLMQLPLEGDPCMSTGVLAHPGSITSVTKSFDGAFVFTAGGEDQSVMQWRVNGERIVPEEETAAMLRMMTTTTGSMTSSIGEVPLDHLIAAVEGGRDGEFMREIVDYFYYAQIRLQGEETTAKRELMEAVPFSQLPNLFRALGYYPSELDIGRLTYEVANLYGPEGESVDECDVGNIPLKFSQFMRLYVNYRPVYGITRHDIECAFSALGADPVTGQISRDVLFKLLSTHGEALQPAEIAAALRSLLGDGVRLDMLEDTITARAFSENLLGFEDYDAPATAVKTNEEEDSLEDDIFIEM
ncbi:WD40 repeat [Trypanosoma melophagium]|uniref:WD40 repeat n=1 Tax=Trypanosoma melophagium TaxID=715481 RepID=UPI00351A374B|nr:WD40 repeat [Trypanosoma melophagium]